MEPYLQTITDFHLRKIVTKFRCSDHRLEIEIGRHNNIPRENRMCKVCSTDIENEMHFLCICPKYKALRTQYLGKEILDCETGKSILKCEGKTITNKLACYLRKSFKEREIHLNT